MKRIVTAIIALLVLGFALQAYAGEDAVSSATVDITELLEMKENEDAEVLVIFFSTNDTVKAVALTAADALGADAFEVVPEIPYTEDDLKYYTDCRADQEQADDTARPGIEALPEDLEKYSTILIGYPIWHGQAPKILYTLLENIDVKGKTIIPFCTSMSSGAGSSAAALQALTDDTATWLEATRIDNESTADDVRAWAVSAMEEIKE